MYPIIKIGLADIYTYSVFLTIALCTCIAITMHSARYLDTKHWKVAIVCVIITALAIPGARLLSLLMESGEQCSWTISGLLSSEGGMAFYGGVLLATPAAIIAMKLLGINILRFMDVIVPVVLTGLAIGRVGCFMNGCCWGQEVSWGLGVIFTHYQAPVRPLGIPLVPTQIISSLACSGIATLCFLLIARQPRNIRDGIIGVIGLICYCVFRFVIEFFRADVRGTVLFMSTSQAICLLLMAIAIIVLLCVIRPNLNTDS